MRTRTLLLIATLAACTREPARAADPPQPTEPTRKPAVAPAPKVLARLDDRQLRQELDAARAQARTAQTSVIQALVEKRGAESVLKREKAADEARSG